MTTKIIYFLTGDKVFEILRSVLENELVLRFRLQSVERRSPRVLASAREFAPIALDLSEPRRVIRSLRGRDFIPLKRTG